MVALNPVRSPHNESGKKQIDFDKVYEERKSIKAGNVTIPMVPIKRLIDW